MQVILGLAYMYMYGARLCDLVHIYMYNPPTGSMPYQQDRLATGESDFYTEGCLGKAVGHFFDFTKLRYHKGAQVWKFFSILFASSDSY